MRSVSDTIARLTAMRALQAHMQPDGVAGRLSALEGFGSNPGALGAWYYIPETAPAAAPLVVVLHGCTQNAAGYNHGSGWSQLADEHGFALLFPEQRRANNMNLCFNWYEPGDKKRDAGEPLSIRQMIETMVERHEIDPARIYINGLSAGGAMTSVMLATYPELFAGGAVIAGLPYGTASNVPEAFDRMRGHARPDGAELAALVRSASPHTGPWPSISVWHGTADRVVDASNGEAILAQWRAIHQIADAPSETGQVDGHAHRVWRDAKGRAAIEEYRIAGMGHGTPLSTRGEDSCGVSGAHMLEAAISSTRHIARFWGLIDGPKAADKRPAVKKSAATPVAPKLAEPRTEERGTGRTTILPNRVGKVIEDALRAAGLMR